MENKFLKNPKQVIWKKPAFQCLIQLATHKVYTDEDANSHYNKHSFYEMDIL